jgi:hypothetical protein
MEKVPTPDCPAGIRMGLQLIDADGTVWPPILTTTLLECRLPKEFVFVTVTRHVSSTHRAELTSMAPDLPKAPLRKPYADAEAAATATTTATTTRVDVPLADMGQH